MKHLVFVLLKIMVLLQHFLDIARTLMHDRKIPLKFNILKTLYFLLPQKSLAVLVLFISLPLTSIPLIQLSATFGL